MIKREIAYNLVNVTDAITYVSDMETRELQFLNKYTKDLLGMDEDDESYRERIVFEKLEYLTVGNLLSVYGLELFAFVHR